MELTPKILSEIDARFEESDREQVRLLLEKVETRESERVVIAILRLARGRVSKIPGLIKDAQADYRDVLAWAMQPTRTYFIGLLRKGPHWKPEDDKLATHLKHELLKKWRAAGQCIVGGWFTDFGEPRGMYIFTVESIEEARELVAEDPGIQSGKLLFEFHPWLAPDGLNIARPEPF